MHTLEKHFLARLLLQHRTISKRRTHLQTAAVMVIVEQIHAKVPLLVLTRRSQHLRHHPGQISFPGGKAEVTDKNTLATALRETEEELGLTRTLLTVHAELPHQNTVTGFQITPYLASVNLPPVYKADTGEVAEVLHLPLAPFLDPNNYQLYSVLRQGKPQQILFIKVENEVIWGATARILWNMAQMSHPIHTVN